MHSSLYSEIQEALPSIRETFIKVMGIDEDSDFEQEPIRSLEEAKQVLKFLDNSLHLVQEGFVEYPWLIPLFEKEFGALDEFKDREVVSEVIFLDDYIFAENEQFPLFDILLSEELFSNYQDSLSDFVKEKIDKHHQSQDRIHHHLSKDDRESKLICRCQKCLSDFRGKFREMIINEQRELIDMVVEKLENDIMTRPLNSVADQVSKLKNRLDRNVQVARSKLKRSSINRLENEIKQILKEKLSQNSDLGRQYKERVHSFLLGIVAEKELSTSFVTDEEMNRFMLNLGVNLWRAEKYLTKEFTKFLNSLMLLKRKDISSTILTEYLGRFWEHSVARKRKRKIIYHSGPTNSGKTYNAIEALSQSKTGCYLAPLRLLAGELYDTLNNKGIKTSLLTGEEVIDVPDAKHYASTIEMALLNEDFECAVIDEIQMITDPQRGWAWTRALVNLNAHEVHLCGDHSVYELIQKIVSLTGDELELLEYHRKTKLAVEKKQIKLVDLERSDALIVFSRRNALKYKNDLERLGFKVSIVYGRLSPEVRREQARKFDSEETDIIVSTDAIAMGMNLPVRRIVFSTLSKFFNSKEYPITDSEIKQIAGRAGRYGRFPTGHVTTLKEVEEGLEKIDNALNVELDQKELAMVGPDLEIYKSVNLALAENGLSKLSLVEFLRLFNTIAFDKPFYCVELNEMIEIAEMVEAADATEKLDQSEVFGFTCAPVNLGLMQHVQYFVWILNHYIADKPMDFEEIDSDSDDIDYLETSIKCMELYQWLARHFNGRNFHFDEVKLHANKSAAVDRLNHLLSQRIVKKCSSCGVKLNDSFRFNICEVCFEERKSKRGDRGGFRRRHSRRDGEKKEFSSAGANRPSKKSSKKTTKKSFSKKSSSSSSRTLKTGHRSFKNK